MINKELDDLIKEYLTDGVITTKERNILLKKAEKLGLDLDEVDLYIDAQQQKIDKVFDNEARQKKGATCPFCGAPVQQLAEKCSYCGQFITAEASKELKEILNNLEDALVNFKSGYNIAKNKAIVERYSRKAELYYSNNPKIKPLLSQIQTEVYKAEKKSKALARKAFFTNPWTYGGLFIILTALVIIFFIYKTAHADSESYEAFWWGLGIFYIGVPCVVGTVAFIKKFCAK